jgi:putative transposase
MPWGLKRFHDTGDLHYLTFTCFHRASFLDTTQARDVFEQTLERVRRWYGIGITGYVVMPEHVHLLLSEPERGQLATAMQMLKQVTARKLHGVTAGKAFWQKRYYDFNVWSKQKRIEKLRYLHRNPVRRGLVEKPEDWAWSSYRHYLTGVEGVVEIESAWTARKRERMGIIPTLKRKNN